MFRKHVQCIAYAIFLNLHSIDQFDLNHQLKFSELQHITRVYNIIIIYMIYTARIVNNNNMYLNSTM